MFSFLAIDTATLISLANAGFQRVAACITDSLRAKGNTRRFSYFQRGLLTASCLTALALPFHNAEAAMDRSEAILGAHVHMYANYLYLTELFRMPTAIPLYTTFCGDTLSKEQRDSLRAEVDTLIPLGWWTLQCAPVYAYVRRNRKGTFDLELRFLILQKDRHWPEDFKTAVVSNDINDRVLISESRQLQLSQNYQIPGSFFRRYSNIGYIRDLLSDLKKISQKITEQDDGDIAVVVFSERKGL